MLTCTQPLITAVGRSPTPNRRIPAWTFPPAQTSCTYPGTLAPLRISEAAATATQTREHACHLLLALRLTRQIMKSVHRTHHASATAGVGTTVPRTSQHRSEILQRRTIASSERCRRNTGTRRRLSRCRARCGALAWTVRWIRSWIQRTRAQRWLRTWMRTRAIARRSCGTRARLNRRRRPRR